MRVRPTVARVDLGVLKANYRAIADHLARQQPSRPPGVIGVVKANAYGHGAAQVGRALEDGGADLLACADIEEGAVLRAAGVRAGYRHAANSAAVVRDPRVWFDRVRPGLLLYGIVPPPLDSAIALNPVMTLTSRVVAVKGMRAGEITGYGARFAAPKPTTIAIVPAGYADGLDLRLAGRGAVLIRGQRAPIVGSVCMDMLIADVTGMDASPGDEVVIIGRQGNDKIDAREMAAAIGSIPWEIVCRVGTRIERVYG